MGLKLCLIAIDTNNQDDKISRNREHSKLKICKTNDLSPQDVHIGFNQDKIIILNESISEIINESSELNNIELEIVDYFPACNIFYVVQYDTIDMIGYTLILKGKKVRSKYVAKGEVLFDKNNLFSHEKEILRVSKETLITVNPEFKDEFEKTINNKSEKEQLAYMLKFLNKYFEDPRTYFNGLLEQEFIDKFLPFFLGGDWTKLTEMDFVRFDDTKINDRNKSITELINLAYGELST